MALANKPGSWILWGGVFLLCLTAFYFLLERPERGLPEREGEPSATGDTGLPPNPAARAAASGGGTLPTSPAPDAPTPGEQVRDASTTREGGPGERSTGGTKQDNLGVRIARALGWGDGTTVKGGAGAGAPRADAPGSPSDASTLLMEHAAPGERASPLKTLEPETSATDGDADATGGLEDEDGNTAGRQDAVIGDFEIGDLTVVGCSDNSGLCNAFFSGLSLAGAPGVVVSKGSRRGDAQGFVLINPDGRGILWVRSGDQLIRANTLNLTTEAQLAQAISDFGP